MDKSQLTFEKVGAEIKFSVRLDPESEWTTATIGIDMARDIAAELTKACHGD